MIAEDRIGKRGAELTITLTSGKVLCETVAHDKGSPGNPLTDDDIAAKFLDVAVPGLGAARVRELLRQCWAADELADFGDLVRGTAGVAA